MKKKWMRIAPSYREGCRQMFLCMRQLLIFLLVFNLNLSATAFSQHQRLSLHLENASVNDLITAIKKQCDVGFIYDYSRVKDVGGINIHVNDEVITDVLALALKGTGLVAKVENNMIIISSGQQQVRQPLAETVRGRVVDKTGDPLIGATVMIKGTSIGTTADAEGKFQLTLPVLKDKVLLINFVGMQAKEVVIKETKAFLSVTLEESVEALNEVVVNGIYARKKESMTGSAATYTSKELKMIGNQNVIQSLKTLDPSLLVFESKEWGSDPNRLPDMEVRGQTSIPGLKSEYGQDPNRPLFILDGFETTLQTIIDMNMDRVESITILKDAASTAIYGSKAANGVIVVETKQPEAGKLRVNYGGSYELQMPDLSDYNLMNSMEKLEFEQYAGVYKGNNFEESLEEQNLYNHRLAEAKRGVNTYWLSEPLRTVFNHRHNISVDGGDDAMRYGIGINYGSTKGVMKGSDRETMGGNISLTYRKKKLIFSNQANFSFTNSEREPVPFSTFAKQNPYYRKMQGDTPEKYLYDIDNTKRINPVYLIGIPNTNETSNMQLRNNFSIDWRILESLRTKGAFGVTKSLSKTERFVSPKHPSFDGTDQLKRGSYSLSRSEGVSYNGNFNIVFGRTFNEKHLLNLVGGFSFSSSTQMNDSYQVKGFIDDYHVNPVFSSGFSEGDKPSYSNDLSRTASFFMNGNYAYDNRYLVDINLRSDGTSLFGSNKRFSNTWSIGLAWNLHNESFIKALGCIDNLKLRTSIGNPGNQNFDAYMSMKTYIYNTQLQNVFGTSAIIDKFGNKDLDWQRTLDFNWGADISILNNRLRLTVDIYNKKTDPLLVYISMPPSIGTTQIATNFGRQITNGYTVSLNGSLIKKQEMNWSLNFNLRKNHSVYKGIGDKLSYLNSTNQGDLVRYYDGASPDDMWAVRSLGIDAATGREVFLKKDGTQTFEYKKEDEVVVGCSRPSAEGVVGSSFYYKGLSVSLNFRYRIGAKQFATALFKKVENISKDNAQNSNQDKRALYDRWQKPGDQAKFKGIYIMDNTTQTSSRFIQKENTFAGESISVGYETMSPWLKHCLAISSLSFRVYMNDIFRISSMKEERGIDYPFARSTSFSLNLRF